MNAYIKAVKGKKTKTFTIKSWNNLPKNKCGWRETSDYVSPEAADAIKNATNATDPAASEIVVAQTGIKEVDVKAIDAMTGKEIQEYIIANNLDIEGYKTMPKGQLIAAIKSAQDGKK